MPLSLGLRIFLVYGVFVGLIGYFVLRMVNEEIKPAVRQSTEETLVDTANLLAELLAEELQPSDLQAGKLASVLTRYQSRHPKAEIWGMAKNDVSHRIYITDQLGIVRFDSAGLAVGQDYSRWNDVYLTLHGKYGARSTRDDPADENSTVMYVAAPIRVGDQIVGVLTVAKPNHTLQPYIERSQRRLALIGGGLIALGLLFGAILSWRFGRALKQLTSYATAISEGDRAVVPLLNGSDLKQLAGAVEAMRVQLEGKAYVEQYVQTLTHELKTPLAAINGAAELLHQDLTTADRDRFLRNIETEAERLHQLSERLLRLSQVESRQGLESPVELAIDELVHAVVESQTPRLRQRSLRLAVHVPPSLHIHGERFLLRHGINNLLDNAIEFTPDHGEISIEVAAADSEVLIKVSNTGAPIPDYALPRLKERFYSLPRPNTGRKSTGLGLNFVEEVAVLHGGALTISNTTAGVVACLTLPRHTTRHTPTQSPH